MKAESHIVIPDRRQAVVIISPAVSFNKDQVLLINLPDCSGDVFL